MKPLRRTRYGAMALLTLIVCLLVSPGSVALTSQQVQRWSDQVAPMSQQVAGATLEQQGRSLYESGQFNEAATVYQQAVTQYQQQGNSLRQALNLGNLALTYQQLGNWDEANQAIANSLSLLRQLTEAPTTVQVLAQILDIQGYLYRTQGNPNNAIAAWEEAAHLHQQLSNLIRAQESQIQQAQALQDLGLYRRAIALLYTVSGLEQDAPKRNGSPIPLADLTIEELQGMLSNLPNETTTAIALQLLGTSLRTIGDLSKAQLVAQHSLELAEQAQHPDTLAANYQELGNILRLQGFATLNLNNLSLPEALDFIQMFRERGDRFGGTEIALQFDQQMIEALNFYQQSVRSTHSPEIQVSAKLNELALQMELQHWKAVQEQLPLLQEQLNVLPPSRSTLHARLNFAYTVLKQRSVDRSMPGLPDAIALSQWLTVTLEQAKTLNDQRSESYALGLIGKLYEQQQQVQQALAATRQAVATSQSIQAADIAYLWQWQLGRLLVVQGNESEAIAAYQEAVKTLNSIRQDLITVTPEEQFLFRDTIEPLHRELVALLLNHQKGTDATALKAARDVIESLQLAELVNFFREDCLDLNSVLIDQVDPQAVIVYPIILSDQLAVIVSTPNAGQEDSGLNSSNAIQDSTLRCAALTTTSSTSSSRSLCYYSTPIQPDDIEITVARLRNALEQVNDPGILAPSQTLYNWLIRPLEPKLNQLLPTYGNSDSPPTLVFVLDGALRNIPMSVLHDGNQYLVERFNIALTPGLQLFANQSPRSQNLSALIGGLQEARQGFSALNFVTSEIDQIQNEVANSQVLLDQQFTEPDVEQAIRELPVPVVHLATHGQFSSKLDQTFLLTWDDRLTINQLRSLLQTRELNRDRPLELLVLSACETAAGDNRAALGLAGMAVQSGARSTLATLWQVSDASSAEFMGHFYREFAKSGVTKAAALRQAQLSLLHSAAYQRPYYWSPYVLVGDWQ
jgi:CHAT domain-containing protein